MAEQKKSSLATAPSTECKGTENLAITQEKGEKTWRDNPRIVALVDDLNAKALKMVDEDRFSYGVLVGARMNDYLDKAASKPKPIALYEPTIYKGLNHCIFGDTGSCKSIYCVQAGIGIATRYPEMVVLDLDFELSDFLLYERYSDKNGHYKFPDNFIHIDMRSDEEVTEEALMASIEGLVVKSHANVVIIDNLTYLCIDSEKGSAAGSLMKKLMQLKTRYELTIIVVAHTPKRNDLDPITLNDLAGSKKLSNFFDQIVSIGKVAGEPNQRYLKELKTRVGGLLYYDPVKLYEVRKDGSFTHLSYVTDVKECTLLRGESQRESQREQAYGLYKQGMSVKDIAAQTEIPAKTLYRWFK